MAKSKATSTINAVLKLASRPVRLEATDGEKERDQISVLVFDTGNESFAVGVEHIEGVVDCPGITPLPNPPEGIIGVTSVRGRMTLVFCLNGGSGPGESRRRLILLKGDAQLGLFADRIEDVVSFSRKELRDAVSRRGNPAKPRTEERSVRRASLCFQHKGRDIPVVDVDRLVED